MGPPPLGLPLPPLALPGEDSVAGLWFALASLHEELPFFRSCPGMVFLLLGPEKVLHWSQVLPATYQQETSVSLTITGQTTVKLCNGRAIENDVIHWGTFDQLNRTMATSFQTKITGPAYACIMSMITGIQ